MEGGGCRVEGKSGGEWMMEGGGWRVSQVSQVSRVRKSAKERK